MTSGWSSRRAFRAPSSRRVGNLATASPREAATSATALALSFRPRPAGRSGWVRTRGISWPAAISASRARAAKGGVPAKTTRKPASGGLALALLQLGPDAVLLELREVLDEDAPL